ncbi:Lipoprotein signal peptidase [Candidatus Erwinia haradaeae]|uniref:Lipoprotein signal peptidase n=1 Tax=Candidatus Erwinia haradaeae TaxID=1922217 RepID=A0A451DI84_9GAMM|nr:Lipoprotein signal peptidase [Candidatus Erwinia haradaeae]
MNLNLRCHSLRWIWIAIIVAIIDISSKEWIIQHLILHESISIIPLFNFYYTRNFGAAFSFLSNQDGWHRWLLSSITGMLIMVLLVKIYFYYTNDKYNSLFYTLIIGGALGNLYDRIYRGFVIDFIDFYIGKWHFATFNIADSAICMGSILLILRKIIKHKNKKS